MNTPNTNSAVFPKYFIFLIPMVCLLIISFDFSPFKLTVKETTYDTKEDCCVTTEKPTKVALLYDGDGTCSLPPENDASCTPIVYGDLGENVYLIVHSSIKPGDTLFAGPVTKGTIFIADATGNTKNNKFPPQTTVIIKSSESATEDLQKLDFHTSCSQPFDVGDRFGPIVVKQLITVKKNGEIIKCGDPTPPTIPNCLLAGGFQWNNTITMDSDGEVTYCDVKFEAGVTTTYDITLPYTIKKNSDIDIKSMVSWFCDPNAGATDQADQRFKLLFRNGPNLVMETHFTGNGTDGILVNSNNLADEWIGDPGIAGNDTLSEDVDNLQLVHYPSGGEVYPASICFVATFNALPISLLTFEAKLMDHDQVELHWTTATETDNNYFELLRSPNGRAFIKIETMEGAGTSSEILDYRCIDKSPYVGYNYYQLKQVDLDGNFTLSNVIMIMVRNKYNDELNINVFPNPTKTSLNYHLDKPLHAGGEIQLIDLLGKIIYTSELVGGQAAKVTEQMDVRRLANGIYYLKVQADQWIKVTPFEIIN